jgi:hypothetical protein
MGFDQDHHDCQPSILPELLRRTLSLLEFYARIDNREQELFELRLALIRAIRRFEADGDATAAAAKGEEPAYPIRDGPQNRKQPTGESMAAPHLDRQLESKG